MGKTGISWSAGQNYKRQQLSCLDSGWGKASQQHSPLQGGRQWPPRAAVPQRWAVAPRPVAKPGTGAAGRQPPSCGALASLGRPPPPLPLGPWVAAPPPLAWPPCPRLPPPRAATGASPSRKLALRRCGCSALQARPDPLSSVRRPGPCGRPDEDSDPRRFTCLSARFLPLCQPRRRAQEKAEPALIPAPQLSVLLARHGSHRTAARPRRKGRLGPRARGQPPRRAGLLHALQL